jgi:hypothetical protein
MRAAIEKVCKVHDVKLEDPVYDDSLGNTQVVFSTSRGSRFIGKADQGIIALALKFRFTDDNIPQDPDDMRALLLACLQYEYQTRWLNELGNLDRLCDIEDVVLCILHMYGRIGGFFVGRLVNDVFELELSDGEKMSILTVLNKTIRNWVGAGEGSSKAIEKLDLKSGGYAFSVRMNYCFSCMN